MKFFNIDLHISVIADLRRIFNDLGHEVDDWTLSEHRPTILDSSKIKRELGFTTSVDLNEGLEETIRTYKRLLKGENNDYM